MKRSLGRSTLLCCLAACAALVACELLHTQPGATCGGLLGQECETGQFCSFDQTTDCGAADQTGMCEELPESCADIYLPVCGCDGKTYGNRCEAHAQAVSVAAQGPCDGAPEPAPAASSADASHPPSGPDAGGPGALDPPESPRDAGGPSVSNPPGKPDAGGPDASDRPGKTCGGIAALQCGRGEFCNYELEAGGQGCDGTISDAAGVCQATPSGCTKEYAPVCGCDGETYGNACTAHAAGVSIAARGECKRAAVSCDRRALRCRRAEPVCPDGQVSSIEGICYGPCVPLEQCVCDEAADCPFPEQFTCHLSARHCGPYVN